MSDQTQENQEYLEERIHELTRIPLTGISWVGEKAELGFSEHPTITIQFEKLRWQQWPPTEDEKKDLKKYYREYKDSHPEAFNIMKTWDRVIKAELGLPATQIGFISTDPE